MTRGFPSMTALLGLLAVAGYQNRDKLAELLGGAGGHAPNTPGAPGEPRVAQEQGGLGGLGGLLGGLGGAGAAGGLGGLLGNLGGSGAVVDSTGCSAAGLVSSWIGSSKMARATSPSHGSAQARTSTLTR